MFIQGYRTIFPQLQAIGIKCLQKKYTNFEKVKPRLYRGPAIDPKDYPILRKLGVKNDIDLRTSFEAKIHKKQCQPYAKGITFHNIPPGNIEAIRAVVRQGSTLIHCQEGVERTGQVINALR